MGRNGGKVAAVTVQPFQPFLPILPVSKCTMRETRNFLFVFSCSRGYAVIVERLQKILSQAGVASRRASERLMLEGRVTVNGVTVRELGSKADPSRDDIRVDGRRIRLPERHRYLLLNKPRGYVTTRSDPQRRPTVIDLVGVRDYVYPVGRLDFDSEGLVLLTNDGDLAAQLTHPSHGVERLRSSGPGRSRRPRPRRLRRGIVIDGRRTAPADVDVNREAKGAGRDAGPGPRFCITVREGRNRQVRHMCDAIGHPVDHLVRVPSGRSATRD